MATLYDLTRRRSEFFGCSFDEMVERILDLEEELAEARDEISELQEEIGDAA